MGLWLLPCETPPDIQLSEKPGEDAELRRRGDRTRAKEKTERGERGSGRKWEIMDHGSKNRPLSTFSRAYQ